MPCGEAKKKKVFFKVLPFFFSQKKHHAIQTLVVLAPSAKHMSESSCLKLGPGINQTNLQHHAMSLRSSPARQSWTKHLEGNTLELWCSADGQTTAANTGIPGVHVHREEG